MTATDEKAKSDRSLINRIIDALNYKVGLALAFLVVIRLLVPYDIVLVVFLSYAFHFINLEAFLFRRYDVDQLIVHSILYRTVALATLGILIWPYLPTEPNWLALVPLALGTALHFSAVKALGLRRTYYAVELGAEPPQPIRSYPYNLLRHPMELGVSLQLVGLFALFPAFTRDYGWLILGHLAFSILTAVVEHFDIHFHDHFFTAATGTFSAEPLRRTVEEVRDWSLEHFREHVHRECSMHRYIKTLPSQTISGIDRIRYAAEIMERIQAAFPKGKIIPLPMTDEIYISRYNYDRGGDQGLFDKHHDGNLRFFPGASVVRSLIYLSSADRLTVVFDTSKVAMNAKTFDYGLLDFHKEFHWVDGSYDPAAPPRVLLKCNYYVDHTGIAAWRRLGIGLNVAVFYVVKAAMEYSKSPKTMAQKCIGLVCNLFRRLNNLSPAAPVLVVLAGLVLSLKAILFPIVYLF